MATDVLACAAHDTGTSSSATGHVVAEDDEEATAVIGVVVHLVDGTSHKLYVQLSTTLRDLGAKAGGRLGVLHFSDFSFYQLLDGCSTPRMLSDELALSDLWQSWTLLKDATGRASRLSWRRRFIRSDEMLMSGDPAHAALTFRQAIAGYWKLSAILDGEAGVQKIYRIAGALLCAEFASGTEAEARAKLADRVFMERLLPACINQTLARSTQGREIFRQRILEEAQKLRPELGPQEHQIQRMSRTLQLLQELKLFGAQSWPAKQVAELPKHMALISEDASGRSRKNLRFDPSNAEAEVQVFVSLNGVFLLPAPTGGSSGLGPGESLARTFLLRQPPQRSAHQRLVTWGARPASRHTGGLGYLQLVVLATELAPAQRTEMVITLECPQAADVAYVLHRAVTEVGGHLSEVRQEDQAVPTRISKDVRLSHIPSQIGSSPEAAA